jgi:hypothetical protein
MNPPLSFLIKGDFFSSNCAQQILQLNCLFNFRTTKPDIQGRYKVWQQLGVSRVVSWKSLRFGMELGTFEFYSLQFFQFCTIICFRDELN